MNVVEQERNGVVIFTLDGRIDSEGAVDLDLALQAAASAGKVKMIVDMSAVPYINSSGLRTLADILTQNRREGGDLRLVAMTPKVRRIFQVIGFDRFFNLFESIDDAIVSL